MLKTEEGQDCALLCAADDESDGGQVRADRCALLVVVIAVAETRFSSRAAPELRTNTYPHIQTHFFNSCARTLHNAPKPPQAMLIKCTQA